MNIENISLPEVYKASSDFRFFCDWFANALKRIQYDTENMFDLYDPLRCPKELLWLLADTIGFKYDDRLPTAYNRLVILYFMSMIRNKGSKDGVTLAAEINLAQFKILMECRDGYIDSEGNQVEPNRILYNRLEDTSIPVNSAYVTPHTEEGYIDVVYFSDKLPIDACIEYVRPVGMYMFQHPGVRYDARTKLSVDAKLTDDISMSIGPTHVGHYRREDYARMQRSTTQYFESDQSYISDDGSIESKPMFGAINHTNHSHDRQYVWNRNQVNEDTASGDGSYSSGTDSRINPGYRALYSLQLCNNEHIVKALISPNPDIQNDGTHPEAIFSLGYGPDEVNVSYSDEYLKYPYSDKYSNGKLVEGKAWNLRYDMEAERQLSSDVSTAQSVKPNKQTQPAVNPVMTKLGDALPNNN